MMPILINNRDRLTTTRKMVDDCRRFGGEPIIVDNASTYPPLMEWYETRPCEIVRLAKNHGPRAPWQVPIDAPRYVVTDCDLDISGVPADVLAVLAEGLERYPWAIKAGLSLEIDDLPDGYKFKQMVLDRERPAWSDQVDDRFYRAEIDTTFAMYRKYPPWAGEYGPALRAARPYTARHVPWYTVDRDDEETYYLRNLNPQGIFWSALANEEFR
jgi:hypothetical protein